MQKDKMVVWERLTNSLEKKRGERQRRKGKSAVKVLHSICQQIWKAAMATGLEKVSFHSNTKERQCQRSSNFHTITLISHAGKIMLKILPARLQQYLNWELPDVQARYRNGRGTRNQIDNIHWIMEKAREFQKNVCFTDYPEGLWLCGS